MTDASAAARPGSPSDSVSAVREQSGCIQAQHRRHSLAVDSSTPGKEEQEEGSVGQESTYVADVIRSVCSQGRQRRAEGGQTSTKMFVALEVGATEGGWRGRSSSNAPCD